MITQKQKGLPRISFKREKLKQFTVLYTHSRSFLKLSSLVPFPRRENYQSAITQRPNSLPNAEACKCVWLTQIMKYWIASKEHYSQVAENVRAILVQHNVPCV